MQNVHDQPSVFARDHTIFGVCEALGEDLGFSPLILRLPLAVCLLFNPLAVIGAYLALGALVAFTRLVSPDPKRRAEASPAIDPVEVRAAEDRDRAEMALAA